MVKVVKKLSDKGYPVHDKNYQAAHRKANVAEKKADPDAYNQINKMDQKLPKGSLAGKHTKSGKTEINQNYTKKHGNISGKRIKNNLVLHEKVETKEENKLDSQDRYSERHRSKM